MDLVLAVAPASEPVTTAEAKLHLRLETTADDAYVDLLIKTAREEAETITGRALISQQWKLYLDTFPYGCYAGSWPKELSSYRQYEISLPRSPLITVDSIVYVDSNGANQTLSSGNYTVDKDRVGFGAVYPSYGNYWPPTRDIPHAVTVTFTAGYANAAAVPESIKTALKLAIAHMYEYRDNGIENRVPDWFPSLLSAYRVF